MAAPPVMPNAPAAHGSLPSGRSAGRMAGVHLIFGAGDISRDGKADMTAAKKRRFRLVLCRHAVQGSRSC